MSLDWNPQKIKHFKDFAFYPDTEEYGLHRNMMRGEVADVIHLTIPLGMGRLTETNYVTFYRRFVQFCLIKGRDLKDVEDGGVTLELIKKMVGLSTNASNKTDAAFRKDLMHELEDQADWRVARKTQALKEKESQVEEIMELLEPDPRSYDQTRPDQ